VPDITFESFCINVVHKPLRNFLSYLDMMLKVAGVHQVSWFEVVVKGANDDEPQRLEYDPEEEEWSGQLGLTSPGSKKIMRVVAHMIDGGAIDVTSDFLEDFPNQDGNFEVRFPQEDSFGVCPAN
jgi:hypothetical protein